MYTQGHVKVLRVGTKLEEMGEAKKNGNTVHKNMTGGGDQSAVVVTVSRGSSSAVVIPSRRSTSVQATCTAGQRC